MLKLFAKISAIIGAILIISGVVDKIFLPNSSLYLQHENYFVAANPFILFAILFYISYIVHKDGK